MRIKIANQPSINQRGRMFVCTDDIHIVSGDVRYTVSNHPFPLNGIHIICRSQSATNRSSCTRDDMYIVSTDGIHCRSYRIVCACDLSDRPAKIKQTYVASIRVSNPAPSPIPPSFAQSSHPTTTKNLLSFAVRVELGGRW